MASQASRHLKATVAGNIRAARDAKGLSQSEVARALGVESFTVSRWERGANAPEEDNLANLVEFLFAGNIAALYVDRSDEPAPEPTLPEAA